MSVGDNIRKLREDKNLTQVELSKLVGVSQPTIAQIERGTKIPTILLGNEIAKALGCNLQALVA